MQAALLVVSGLVKESIVSLGDKDELTIGRAPQNRLVIEDAAVSRTHCAIRVENGEFVLRDLGSRSGTYVNGARIESRALAHADSIRVGLTTFMFVRADEAAATFPHEIELDASSVYDSGVTQWASPEEVAADSP